MNRFLTIGIMLVLGVEGFRAWWFHSPAVAGEETWEGTPRLVIDRKAIEAGSAMREFSVADYVDTGALQYDRAAFLRVPIENAETGTGGSDSEPGDLNPEAETQAGEIPRPREASRSIANDALAEGPLPSLLFLEYRPGNGSLWNDLFTHPPEVCMRSSGCALEGVLPSQEFSIEGQSVPVRCLKYREPVTGAPLFVFKMVWLPPESPIHPSTEKPEKRPLWIKMALTRRQTPPGSVLLARVRQVEDFETAWEIVETQMLPHLQLQND